MNIFGSNSPQNLLFEQIIAINSGSDTSLNTQLLSRLQWSYNQSNTRAARWKELCMTSLFEKQRLLNLISENQISRSWWEIGADWIQFLAKLPNFSRCCKFAHSQALRTEVPFQNFNEKEKMKIFGSNSPQNILFEWIIAINSCSDTILNTNLLSRFQWSHNQSNPRAAKWKEGCMT